MRDNLRSLALIALSTLSVILGCGEQHQSTGVGNGDDGPGAANLEDDKYAKLPKHVFNNEVLHEPAWIRATVSPGELTRVEAITLAVELAKKYSCKRTTVQFFDVEEVLHDWSGSGLKTNYEWEHWLFEVTVFIDDDGNAGPTTFGIATDQITGEPRPNVLKPD